MKAHKTETNRLTCASVRDLRLQNQNYLNLTSYYDDYDAFPDSLVLFSSAISAETMRAMYQKNYLIIGMERRSWNFYMYVPILV